MRPKKHYDKATYSLENLLCHSSTCCHTARPVKSGRHGASIFTV